jgi:xylulokinase
MNAVLYGVDTRAAAEIEELTTQIGEKSLVEHCGQALTSQSVGPKILWLRRNRPEIFARTAKIVNSTTYLVWKLTGRYVLDHEWSDVLAPDLLPLEKLPELLWTTEIAGGVTKAAAEVTGLAVGTPVTTGTIDAASEAIMLVMYEHWLPAESVIGDSGTRHGSFPASTRRRRPSPPAEL